MEELLAQLREFDALRDEPNNERADTVHIRMLPSQPPTFPPPESWNGCLPPALRDALTTLGISALYSHQVEAIKRIRAGEDVVLEAPTASGKTLCFNLPLALALLEDPPGTRPDGPSDEGVVE